MRNSDGNSSASATASGVGVTGLLGVAFVVLKLCGVINWPWIWVLSPFWISFSIGVLVLIGWLIFVIWLSRL